jgi:hypothetical protein
MLKQVLKPAAYGMELDMAPAELVASLPETALVMSGYGISRGQLSEDERTFHGLTDAIDPAPGRRGLQGMQTNCKVTGMKAYHSPCRSKTMLTRVSH